MNIEDVVYNKHSLKLEFFRQVFEKCKHVSVFSVRLDPGEYLHLTFNDMLEGVLRLISDSLLSKLTLLHVAIGSYFSDSQHHVNSNDFTILIDVDNPEHYHKVSKILLRKSKDLGRNPKVCAEITGEESLDLSTLIQEHVKELYFKADSYYGSLRLTASSEFPFCPYFTRFTADDCIIDDSVPAAFMKAVKNGKFPNLRRIELKECRMNDCEWPQIPEFSLEKSARSGASHAQKLLLNLTEMADYVGNIDHMIKVPLEKLSVLTLYNTNVCDLKCLNNMLKQGFLPNLSELIFLSPPKREERINTFLHEFEPNTISKLETLELHFFIMSADDLKILSEKLTSLHVTELDLSGITGIAGSLSALLTHSLLTLNTLILYNCDFNSDDVQSLAQAEIEGKLPQLKYLDISWNDKVDISDLFTHSAQWNRLTTLKTSDGNVLNVDPEFLASLEELIIGAAVRSITRQWPRLKVIEVQDRDIASCIADGVERGMFPSLTTIRIYDEEIVPISHLFKLYRANISVEYY